MPGTAWSQEASSGGVEVRFLGRGGPRLAADLDQHLGPEPPILSWLEQIHSNGVLEARPGRVGRADALVTDDPGVALAIASADCVPVLLAEGDRIAAAHAGWRGLVAGVLDTVIDRLFDPTVVEAWIGPAIGPCCYEVGDDVAGQLADASDPDVVSEPPGGRTHVDLRAAAIHQLRSRGIMSPHVVDLCTRCNQEILWSYRGQGAEAARNWSVVWRRGSRSR